jgi:dTDP-4-dehydrorhamnose reductase
MQLAGNGSRKKVMVLGARGMLGHVVATFLEESGHEVVSVSRNGNFGGERVMCDLEEWRSLQKHLEYYRPEWVINAAGFLNDDVDHSLASAIYINSYLPQRLSSLGSGLGFRMITIGSDCVFEGNRGQYEVTDRPDAISAYGRTKYLGEVNNDRDLTIRTSIVGPEIETSGRGLLLWFMSQNHKTEGWTEAIWTGVTTLELSKVIESLVSGRIQETGLWQLVPAKSITKFELLQLFNQTFRKSELTVAAIPGLGHDRSLVNDRADRWAVPSYLKMLSELHDWLSTHQHLYENTVFELIDVEE